MRWSKPELRTFRSDRAIELRREINLELAYAEAWAAVGGCVGLAQSVAAKYGGVVSVINFSSPDDIEVIQEPTSPGEISTCVRE